MEKWAKAYCIFSPLASLTVLGESSFNVRWGYPHCGHQSRPQLHTNFLLTQAGSQFCLSAGETVFLAAAHHQWCYWLLQHHRPSSFTAHAPDPPPFLQLRGYCHTPAPRRGWHWGTRPTSHNAARKGKKKKGIHHPSQHILLARCPSARTVAEGWRRGGMECSAEAGGGRAAQDTAQERNPEETAASALSERSTWGRAVPPTRSAAHCHMSSQFWGQFSRSFPYGNKQWTHSERRGATALVAVSSLMKILMCDLHTTEELAISDHYWGKTWQSLTCLTVVLLSPAAAKAEKARHRAESTFVLAGYWLHLFERLALYHCSLLSGFPWWSVLHILHCLS